MYILDTDHLSLFQRNHPYVSTRVLATSPLELATTIITLEEQMRGRLNRVRQARSDEAIVRAYQNLQATSLFFRTITVIAFDEHAQRIFKELRAQKVRISTQDLRIAAIVLHQKGTLVTRNRRDFAQIPDLKIEDWSVA
jgi:tRNA(fMet)-specific endonuclease VapC